jgi:hypothetical protein
MRRAAALALLGALTGGCALLPPAPSPGTRESAKALRVAPPCRASQLRPSLQLQGATGSQLGRISFQVVGPGRCSLFGRPRVSFVASPSSVRLRVVPISPLTPSAEILPPRTLTALRRGSHVVVDLHWLNWCAGAGPAGLVVTLPVRGTGRFRLEVPGRARCDAPDEPSVLRVGPFLPVRR